MRIASLHPGKQHLATGRVELGVFRIAIGGYYDNVPYWKPVSSQTLREANISAYNDADIMVKRRPPNIITPEGHHLEGAVMFFGIDASGNETDLTETQQALVENWIAQGQRITRHQVARHKDKP